VAYAGAVWVDPREDGAAAGACVDSDRVCMHGCLGERASERAGQDAYG